MPPQLVWADWLHSQGDVRAEFVSAQIEREGLEEDSDRAHELLAREAAWLRSHGSPWLSPLRALGVTDTYWLHESVTIRGGLVRCASFSKKASVEALAALPGAAPCLRRATDSSRVACCGTCVGCRWPNRGPFGFVQKNSAAAPT